MIAVGEIAKLLEQLAPHALAETWDNVGLLLGDPQQPVARLMTCLTLTEATVQEAIERQVQLVVAHHPLPFRPVARITTSGSAAESLIWRLASHRISVYSLHTAYDGSEAGINPLWAQRLGLHDARPLRPLSEAGPAAGASAAVGGGRFGRLAQAVPLAEFVELVKRQFGCSACKVIASAGAVQSVAVACGSGGEFVEDAVRAGCDTLVTGEARFHTCLEAQAQHLHLILVGHYASERPGVEQLAIQLQERLAGLEIWPSRQERDPVTWM